MKAVTAPTRIMVNVLILSFIYACILKGGQCQECAAGLTKDQTFPVCPGALVTYTCTVAGTNFTAWTGSGFFQFCNDTLNETIITHYLIESTDLNNTFINESECGPFLALRNDAETTVGCYVSNLEFSATSPGPFNGTTVECFDGDGIRIGTDIVGIAGPPSKPLNLRVVACDSSDRTLTLSWDKPTSNGGSPILQYSLIVEPATPQCDGICSVNATQTQFTFGPLNTSIRYTFTVHADNCDNATQQGDQSNITVFYGGPHAPMGLSGALVYQEDELITIMSTWEQEVPLDILIQCNLPVIGFEVSYISHFSDPVIFNIDLEHCFGGTCSHTYDIVNFDIPMYTLSVSSKSLLGAGPPILLDLVSARNDFVNITVNATTPYPEASCQVLCGFGKSTTVQCVISYSTDATELGQPDSPTDASITNGSLGETLSFPLTEPFPPNTTYYYQVVAFSADQRITVNGNFSTGNYSGECDPVQLVADNNASNTLSNTTCFDGREGVVNSDNNLLVCYNGVMPSSVAELTCSKGYSLESDNMNVKVSCLVNGLWNYYPSATCRKEKDSQIIGGSVGGVLGLMLIIGVVTIYCKISKKGTKVNKVMMKYKQGASEELLFLDDCDETVTTPLQNTDGKGRSYI